MFFQESPLRIFRRIMSTPLEHLPIRKMRPLAITFHNAETRREEKHIGFIFCMGAVARVIKLYEAEGKAPISGLKHIGLGMSASFFGFPRTHGAVVGQFEAEQWADGERLNRDDPLIVLCSVTESLLFGIEPFAGFAESNQFYAISYSIPASVISALVPVAWRATVVPPGERFFNRPVFSFSLRPTQEHLIFVDGDFYSATPGEKIQIELGPELSLVSSF